MLHDEPLERALRAGYGIEAASLRLVSGGEDDSARVYRVWTGPGAPAHVVKVREARGRRDVAAAVARHLHDAGLGQVVAPVRSQAGAPTFEDGALSLTVYPFLDARTGVEAGLDERHWPELGELVRRLHETVLPPALAARLPVERYRPDELESIRRIDDAVSEGRFAGPAAEETAAFWADRRGEILALVERTEELGRLVERLALPLVLCHADLHTWNVLIDGAGGLWLIDWDEVVRAPRERDLMFVVGGIGSGLVEPHETAWFLEGYGEARVDPLALTYYRHAWAVQDLGSYGERIFFAEPVVEERRAHAARMLTRLFAPGQIVEVARASDEGGS